MRHAWKWFSVVALFVAAAAVAKSVETTSGIIYIQNKQYEEARTILLKAIAKDPKDDDGHFYLAIAYSELDSVALAYSHFMKAKELEPKKARDAANNIAHNYAKHYQLGQSAFKQTDVTKAANEFLLATQADPTQSSGHYNLAVMYSRLAMSDSTYHAKTLEEADKVLAMTEPSDPNYTNSVQLATTALAQLGRIDEAVARVQTLVEKDPSKYATVEGIGNQLFDAKNWKAAATILQLAADARAKVGADDFDVYNKIGVARFNLRKEDPAMVDAAIEAYTKALDLKPDDAATVFNLMVAHFAKENWGEAAMNGEKYVGMSPNDASGWQYLAQCYNKMGESEKAMEALQRYNTLKGQ
jgi:tetratricopeptide (TPR) repeat protein